MARVVTPERAVRDGTTAASLRATAAWKFEAARHAGIGFTADPVTAERHRAEATALLTVADEVERLGNRKSRRRAA